MAKRQSGFDLNKYVVMGMQAELEVLKAAQAAIEAQLRQLTRGRRGTGSSRARGQDAAALDGAGTNGAGADGARRRRKRSAAARKRMSEAQKARWAKRRAAEK